ncbi:MAG TPA: TlpA disulfide reductase family protein [Pyrinomonadaceae bacterium]|nr:TlpA disulfide reductase family protein [Pyrinomonadaceae bacterium]
MKKLALALMFALHSGGAFASTGALPARELSVDGNGGGRHAVGGRGAQRKPNAAAQQQRRAKRVSVAKGKPGGASEAALVPVTEIDADGLKNLLPRGGDGGDDAGAGRPLLINFWATWCDPCRKEFPDLVKIDADYRGRGLEFILVSADDVSDIKTTVPKFLRQMRATSMPAYLLNAADTEAAIAQVDPEWGGELPATFLFDRQGKLAYRHFGIIKDAELREAINKVLGNE